MDEEIQTPAENENVVAPDVTESPTVEAEAAPAEAPEVEEPKDEPKPRNNASSRIRELVSKTKQLEAERNQYAEMLQNNAQMPVPENLSEDQYRALAADANYATVRVQDLERRLAYKDFTSEVDVVEQKYPELNPESDGYNSKLAEALAKTYEEGFIVKDKNGRFVSQKKSLSDFTKEMLDAYRTAEIKGATKTQEALAQQAAESVVTPQSTNNSETKAFKDLSIEEMEKQLGVVRA